MKLWERPPKSGAGSFLLNNLEGLRGFWPFPQWSPTASCGTPGEEECRNVGLYELLGQHVT
jgi:hypothetical protein